MLLFRGALAVSGVAPMLTLRAVGRTECGYGSDQRRSVLSIMTLLYAPVIVILVPVDLVPFARTFGTKFSQTRRLAFFPHHKFIAQLFFPTLEFTPNMAIRQTQRTSAC